MIRPRYAASVLAKPFTSERCATALFGMGVAMQTVPLATWLMGTPIGKGNVRVVLTAAVVMLMVASTSLLMGSSRRSYRDNTGNRAFCEAVGLISILICVMTIRRLR